MVIDTSVFIEFLRSKNKKNTSLYNIPDKTPICISVVTLYELLMGATDEVKQKDIARLIEGITILSFDKEVSVKSAEIYHILRKKNQMIEYRDIFIAATSIVNELPLFTLNKKHFSRVAGLNFYDQ